MARIPKHELDELKRHVSLLSLAQSQGHKFKNTEPTAMCACARSMTRKRRPA